MVVFGEFNLNGNFLTNFSMKKEGENTLDPRTKKRIVIVISTLVLMLVLMGVALTLRLIREAKYKEAKEKKDE